MRVLHRQNTYPTTVLPIKQVGLCPAGFRGKTKEVIIWNSF